MALTADLNYETKGDNEKITLPAAAVSTTLYKGAIINIAAGLAKKCSDTNGEVPTGVCMKNVVTAGASAEDVDIETGKLWMAFSSAAQTDVGKIFYATADDTVANAAGTNAKSFGLCIGFKTGYVLINTQIKSVTP